ncbi:MULTISPECIES: hypothetical protein [Streptococcus]|jgi:hypothetical protein|uniref:Uncharacterized protein n=1 Tax=Streptococcus mitis SK1073 TaxID=1008452 RepID=F9HCN3_STRMT|nr:MULTISPECIES: hypothetical protein [Streptococcus]EGP68194.1 hypothetical protein HMPREF9958_0407 [Streptococcus mitis SK1073]MCP9060524.1 hypothetical protein [Streptococcus sp. CF7_Ac1-12]MCP9085105.1 hypothetical protein [Streptococcus sp. CF7_Ac1-8]
MNDYFKEFEKELVLVEEKLDILSDWHNSKNHIGAMEIVENCNSVITNLWLSFYKSSEAYKMQEASHEEFYNKNVENLLGELKKYDDECAEMYNKKPDWLLFNYLNQVINENKLSNGITHETASTWTYLRSLVVSDLQKRGLLK